MNITNINTVEAVKKKLKNRNIKIIANSNGHNWGPIGSVIFIGSTVLTVRTDLLSLTRGGNNNMNLTDFELVNTGTELIKEELKKVDDKIENLKNNKESYNEYFTDLKKVKDESDLEITIELINNYKALKKIIESKSSTINKINSMYLLLQEDAL